MSELQKFISVITRNTLWAILLFIYSTSWASNEIDCVTNSKDSYYVLVLDGNDCNRCTMLVNGIRKENRNEITYIYFKNVPQFGQSDLLDQIGIDTNLVQILNGSSCIDSFLLKLNLQPGERSGVIKYTKDLQSFSYLSFKELVSDDVEQKFFSKFNTRIHRTVLSYKKFFSFANSFSVFNNSFIINTNAASDLIRFDSTGKLTGSIAIDTSLWRSFYNIYQENILNDSLKRCNNDSLSLVLYEKYLKGMGQQLWTFQSSFIANDYLACVVNVFFTVNYFNDKLRHDGAEFICLYNKNFELQEYYMIPRGGLNSQYNGGAFNGIGFQEGKFRIFPYPIDTFALKDSNPVSLSYETTTFHRLKPLRQNIPFITKEELRVFEKEPNLFSLKHYYTTTDYVYFERFPLVIDKQNQIIRIDLNDSLKGFFNLHTIEKGSNLISLISHNNQLKLILCANPEGHQFIIQKELLIDQIPKEEVIQGAYIQNNDCRILTLNDREGLVVYTIPIDF